MTDLLGFEGPLCGPPQLSPLDEERERKGGRKGRGWHFGPCSRERGQNASSPIQDP